MNNFFRNLITRFASHNYLSYWLILALDIFLSVMATFLTLLFMGLLLPMPGLDSNESVSLLLLSGAVSVLVFNTLKTHRSIIRHSSLKSVWKLAIASVIKVMVMFMPLFLMTDWTQPMRIFGMAVDGFLTFVLLVTIRVAMILVYDLLLRQYGGHRSRILIYGVNDLSMSLKLALHTSKHYQAVAFVIPSKKLCSYHAADLPIFYFEDPAQFAQLMDKYKVNGVLFPDEASAQKEADNLIPFCEQHGIKSLVAPSIDLQKGGLKKTVVRDVRIEDLLGRKEIVINLNKIISNFCDKTVMVTGGAGSIGSELCRQLATFDVKRLVIFDNAETPLHLIRLELEKKFPNLNFVPFIGDVRDENRLEMAFEVYKPQVVFHAAAYKHVPLMEENPCEAIRVNVMGSRRVAEFCVQYEVEKMVMISTDKAVNPTNVMGASKRLAEIYVQSLGLAIEEGRIQGKTHFVTTRFGNVLGSNGSVIPFFRQQINEGGPVTVTHKDIVRFFMTIPEACRLVMEAATMSKGNDIFVFDMGKAVKIADMARRMIRLAGYVPDEDIEIQYTGLRPGEKLYEEVLSNEENTKPTGHEKIRTAEVRRYVYEDILPLYDELAQDARGVEVEKTVRQMKKIVPEYKSNNSIFEELDKETGLK